VSLSLQILAGLLLGVAVGLFFGEPMGVLAGVGDAFVKLLQMTVLPYVTASLIAGLGRMEGGVARLLALRGGLLLLMLWAVAFALVALTPLAFPHLQTASFFSTTLLEDRPAFDFVKLYIPSNPFRSMADNLVPAVVLFSIAVGIALMRMPGKERLIAPLETLAEALNRVAGFVIRLMPLGVFAIGASAAGTMQLEEAQRIQVYLLSYILGALGMGFLVLPGIVSALTPIPFREVVRPGRGLLLTAFATGSEFVVLPLIGDRCKELLRRHFPDRDDAESLVDVVVPVAFSFPHVAKVLSLGFVPFAAWFSGTALDPWDYPKLGLSGILSLFGSINLAMPFLLDLMHLPQDLFQLFLTTGVVNARFGTLLAAMHILSLTLLASCAIAGGFHRRWLRALGWGAGSLGAVAALFLGCRLAYASWFDTTYRKSQVLAEMQIRPDDVRTVVHREVVPAPPLAPGTRRVDAIRDRGVLRVCYDKRGFLPFVFFNARGELVGFDAEMAHDLASGLAVDLALVPIEGSGRKEGFAVALSSGYCDLGMTHTAISLAYVQGLDYSVPYLDLTVGFLTRDHRRREFADLEPLVSRNDLRLAMPADRYYAERLSRVFPNAKLMQVDGVETFLKADPGEYDALLYLAEAASAWTLLHPEFAVVVPRPGIETVPLAYLLPEDQPDWMNSVDAWIELKKRDGTIQRLYDYWILGREAERTGPRWSVVRDVLHWVD